MNIEAFILIGGKSSRLGTAKAFAEFEGEILIERTARIIKTAFDQTQIKFVAASNGQFDDTTTPQLGFPVVYDGKPGFGAWSGLHAALTQAQSEWIFVTACDYPMVCPAFLKLLASCIADDYEVVVPRQLDGRLQPLCAFYRVRSSLVVVDAMLTDCRKLPPLTAIFEKLKSRILESYEYDDLENSEKLFFNINTPADLDHLTTKTQRSQR